MMSISIAPPLLAAQFQPGQIVKLGDLIATAEAEFQRRYYEENRDKIAENKRRYYEENRDKIAENKRRYREENRDKIAENKRRYREENRDKIAENKRRYYEENREKWRIYKENRQARLAMGSVGT